MYDFPSDPSGRTGPSVTPGPGPSGPCGERHHSVLGLVLLIAAVAIAGTAVLGFGFWALGFMFHIAGMILRVAILAAVAAFVWKRIMRRPSRRF